MERQGTDAEGGTADASELDEVIEHGFGGVDGNGEADAGAASAGRGDHGVDADDFSVGVEERAAGVAGMMAASVCMASSM